MLQFMMDSNRKYEKLKLLVYWKTFSFALNRRKNIEVKNKNKNLIYYLQH